MMNDGPISWKIRLPFFVFLPTSKAEFVAARQESQEVVYLRENSAFLDTYKPQLRTFLRTTSHASL